MSAAGELPRRQWKTLGELLADSRATAPAEAVADPLVFCERVTLLSAREKTGKSTLAGELASAVSSGGTFLGEPTTKGRVLYCSLEEHTSDLVTRLQTFGADPDLVILERLTKPLVDLHAVAADLRPRLLVIDTLAALVSPLRPDSGSSSDWQPIMDSLRRIARDSGPGTLILHHSRKSGGYRDSTAIGAAVDLQFEMLAKQDSVRSFSASGRLRVEDFELRQVADESGVERYRRVGRSITLRDRIIRALREEQGQSLRSLRQNVGGSAYLVGETVRQLLDSGDIEDWGSGQRMSLAIARRAHPHDGSPVRPLVARPGTGASEREA